MSGIAERTEAVLAEAAYELAAIRKELAEIARLLAKLAGEKR